MPALVDLQKSARSSSRRDYRGREAADSLQLSAVFCAKSGSSRREYGGREAGQNGIRRYWQTAAQIG